MPHGNRLRGVNLRLIKSWGIHRARSTGFRCLFVPVFSASRSFCARPLVTFIPSLFAPPLLFFALPYHCVASRLLSSRFINSVHRGYSHPKISSSAFTWLIFLVSVIISDITTNWLIRPFVPKMIDRFSSDTLHVLNIPNGWLIRGLNLIKAWLSSS